MYYNILKQEKIERILDDVLADLRHDEDWLGSFPSVFGYEPFLPDSIEEAIKYPNALYSDDHAIATKAILYSSCHNFQQFLEAAYEKCLRLKKSGLNYRQFHPLFYGFGESIEAHHLICTAVMKGSTEWSNACKITGYNLNCRWNGVFLPYLMSVACTAKIPLHRGGHGAGYGGKDDSGKHTTYAAIVRQEANAILSDAREEREECPDKEEMKEIAKGVVDTLNELSETAFSKVKDFVWTLTADGFDYMPGNPIGCANYGELKDKKGALGNNGNYTNLHNDIKKIR